MEVLGWYVFQSLHVIQVEVNIKGLGDSKCYFLLDAQDIGKGALANEILAPDSFFG